MREAAHKAHHVRIILLVSVVRGAVGVVQSTLSSQTKDPHALQILAKLEARQSLFAFKDIAAASDGVIMSRGNLGLDVVPEKMALIQKVHISGCQTTRLR